MASPPAARRRHRSPIVAAAVLVVSAVLAGCGRGEFEDRTARVDVGGRTTTYSLDACGLDGETLFVVGRSEGGRVLQAVVGLEADRETGVPDSTGLSVSEGDVDLTAFGPEAWARRGEAGEPPGRVTSARLRGSRIQAAGRVVAVDADGVPAVSGDGGTTFSLDARCDEQDRPA